MSIGPVPRKLLSDEVFLRLRDAIVRSELAPGEKVRDQDLAERFGLSRTPVREALNRLVEAGLVDAKPGVYTRIAPLDRTSAERTLDVLRALDTLAVSTAVPRMSCTDLDEMRVANRDFERAVERDDIDAALEADDRFHGVPLRAADNPTLTRIVEQLHPQIHRILYLKFSTLLGGRNTIEHHDAFVRLCASGDAAAAAHESGQHWARLGGHITELFATQQLV
jgi:DNA-binding GntR family transcriptional regulator